MKLILSLVVFLGISFFSIGQTDVPFKVKTVFQKEGELRKSGENTLGAGKPFYEDETYLVKKICMGEWGGIIRFKDKKTGVEYESKANCPVSVVKFNGRYFVTNSHVHLSYWTDIIEIENPKKLDKVPANSKIHLIDGRELISSEEMDAKTRRGTKALVDTMGILTLGSFPYAGKLYYVVSDNKSTYLAELKAGKFVMKQLISEKSLWAMKPEMVKTKDNHFIMFFYSREVAGFIDVYENEITVNRYW